MQEIVAENVAGNVAIYINNTCSALKSQKMMHIIGVFSISFSYDTSESIFQTQSTLQSLQRQCVSLRCFFLPSLLCELLILYLWVGHSFCSVGISLFKK